MHKFTKLLLQRSTSCVISLTLIALFVALMTEGAIEAHWAAMFSGAGVLLMASVLWLVWLVHFAWLLSKQPHVLEVWKAGIAAVVTGLLLLFIAGKTARHFETIALKRDVQPAINAGLYADCIQLMQTRSTNQDRIYRSDTNFASLPSSIKLLQPVYVDNSTDPGPPNIGICKNGFGGFAMGVRVFRSDDDAMKFSANTPGTYLRLATGIYIWWHPT